MGTVPLIIGYTGYNIIVLGHISCSILASAGSFHGYRSYTYIHACMHALHYITLHLHLHVNLHLHLHYITLHFIYITLHVRLYTCMYVYIYTYPLRTPSMMVDDSGRVQPALCSSKQAAWTKRDLQFMKTFIALRF